MALWTSYSMRTQQQCSTFANLTSHNGPIADKQRASTEPSPPTYLLTLKCPSRNHELILVEFTILPRSYQTSLIPSTCIAWLMMLVTLSTTLLSIKKSCGAKFNLLFGRMLLHGLRDKVVQHSPLLTLPPPPTPHSSYSKRLFQRCRCGFYSNYNVSLITSV